MLFIKELKKAVLSIPFIILILGLLLMVYSQEVLTFNEGDKINPPVPGQENYGTKIEEDPEVIMPAAFASLYMEFMANSYATYPIGFIKYVTLGTGEQQEIAQILASLSGKNAEDIYNESIEGNSFEMCIRDSSCAFYSCLKQQMTLLRQKQFWLYLRQNREGKTSGAALPAPWRAVL